VTGNKPGLVQAIKSAFSAMLGIQSSGQHKEDFESETPFPFILAGVILVVGFVLLLVSVVEYVIS
jgi:hypothetical protein